MNGALLRLMLRSASSAALATALSWLLMDLSAPDACLDSGGVFDHVRRLCSFDGGARPVFVDVPMTALTSFHVFLGCAVAFLAIHIASRSRRRDRCPTRVDAGRNAGMGRPRNAGSAVFH